MAQVIPPGKSLALYVVMSLLLPGTGDLYFGWRRQGAYKLASVLLSFPLIFAFGLGLFLLAVIWLGTLGRCIALIVTAKRA